MTAPLRERLEALKERRRPLVALRAMLEDLPVAVRKAYGVELHIYELNQTLVAIDAAIKEGKPFYGTSVNSAITDEEPK